jgi:hypothetical protein
MDGTQIGSALDLPGEELWFRRVRMPKQAQ